MAREKKSSGDPMIRIFKDRGVWVRCGYGELTDKTGQRDIMKVPVYTKVEELDINTALSKVNSN
jgi:hypothetical protein